MSPDPRPTNALEAANVLVRTLNLRFGEVTIQVADGTITLIRHGTLLKPADLVRLAVAEE